MNIRRSVLCRAAQLALLLVLAGMGPASNLWAQGDQCSAPTIGPGTGPVGNASGAATCGVVITIPASGAPTIVIPNEGNGNPYDGTEDTLVGIQNNSNENLDAITLSSPSTGIFGFDGDGPCDTAYHTPAYSWCPAGYSPDIGSINPEGYAGPDNTFTNISENLETGTVVFTTPIPPGGSTWFALEGQPSDLTGVSETAVTQIGQAMNPNSQTNLNQSFVFNAALNNHVEFDFNYLIAFDPTLTVVANTVPTIAVQGITPAVYTEMVAGTSLATTICLLDTGLGTDVNGNALYCPAFTITCTNANSNMPMGDNCPQSTARNLLFTEDIDASGTVTIASNTAPTLAMGSDTWSPGNCVLNGGESGFLCPQSELTAFQLKQDGCRGCNGGGTGLASNSTFIFGIGEQEWSTTPMNLPAWTSNTTVQFSLASVPPSPPLACSGGSAAPGCNGWVASPNKNIIWGEEALNATPDTTFPVAGDTTVANATPCANTGAWPSFGAVPPNATTPTQQVMVAGPGLYEIHFFSTACDNQEELAYPGSVGGVLNQNLATFKTASFGVDQTAPTISTPVINGAPANNVVQLGANVTASFNCTDNLSGLAGCGNNALPLPANYAVVQTGQPVPTARVGPTAGPLNHAVTNYPVPTSSAGPQTLTVYATDEAGNQSSAKMAYSVPYCITSTDNLGNPGFTAPVLNPGPIISPGGSAPNINSASVSQTIPLQITVTDCYGHPITNLTLAPTGTVVLTAANANVCAVDVPDNTLSTAAAGNSGWQNLGLGMYQYNWKPLPPKGACLSFSMNLGDNIQHTVYSKFK